MEHKSVIEWVYQIGTQKPLIVRTELSNTSELSPKLFDGILTAATRIQQSQRKFDKNRIRSTNVT